MTRQELFEKNMVLATDLNRYVLEHPDIAERIPKNAEIPILSEYDKELAEENLKIAKTRKKRSTDASF